MRPETRKAMEMLFSAKWNVPKAAEHCGLSIKEMKITFNEYCHLHPTTYQYEEYYGAQLSLVERCLWEADVTGSNPVAPIRPCSPTAETEDLKSFQQRFESDHGYGSM